MLICLLQQNLFANSANSQIASYSPTGTEFRTMDLKNVDLDYVFEIADMWNIDKNSLLTVLLMYHLPFTQEDCLTKNQVLQKTNLLIKKYPDSYRQTKAAVTAVFSDLSYFPVPVSQNGNYWVNYVDSWGFERTYGGKRQHEGTDIMADRNESGLYPIVSITDGIVENKGWLEKGGWRIGIRSNDGGYFYYAHLSGYAELETGDTVKAGQIIGFMGNTGYGVREGTSGLFDVHLHLGIYIDVDGTEVSINPYWILKYLEKNVLVYQF
jgi:murein DD-endopeptidase MepM/ murein hydrolase activator NlpD